MEAVGVDLKKYLLIFGIIYSAITLIIFIAMLMFPAEMERLGGSAGIGGHIGSAFVAYTFFMKDNLRLFSRGEYWMFVALCTLVSVAIQAVFVAIPLYNAENIPFGGLAFIAIGQVLLNAVIMMIGYSEFIGRKILKSAVPSREVR